MSNSYTIGFTIHDAKSLVTASGNPVDPLVVVRCQGKEYSTEIKRFKTGVVSWDESCVWSDIVLHQQNWSSASIVFEVQAANAFWRNDVIGSCALQLSMIHARRCHQVKRTLPLYLVNEPEVKGFLSITVYVVGHKDTPPNPDDRDSDDEFNKDDGNIALAVIDSVLPEKVTNMGKSYHLYVSVHRVEHLPLTTKVFLCALHTAGERDPFLTCEFAGSKLKSSQARSTCNHSFNECFRIPVVTPVQQDSVILKLWDWNFLASDELLACGRLSFAELRGRPVSLRWFNFYGFDKENNSQASNSEDDEISAPPNYYLGRLQLSARAERLDRSENLMPAQIIAAESAEDVSTISLSLLADVYEVSGVSSDEVCVEVWCGMMKRRTAWVSANATGGQWNKSEMNSGDSQATESTSTFLSTLCFFFDQPMGRIDPLPLTVPEDEKQQWMVLISVYARGGTFRQETRVAYHSFSLSSLPVYVDINPQTPCWIPLRIMPRTSTTNLSPVAVLMTLEKSLAETVARGKRRFLTFYDYELRCYIYAARYLPPQKGYLLNPTARVCCAGAIMQTTVQKETNHPVFMECLRLNCRLSTDPSLNVSTLAPIIITIIDVRTKNVSAAKKQDDTPSTPVNYFVARAICHYDRLRVNKKSQQVVEKLNPRWIEMRGGANLSSRAGDILISFELLRKKDAPKIPVFPMRPELVRCSLTVSVASLRDLVMPKPQAGFFDWLLNQDAETTTIPIKRPVILASVSVWETGVASSQTGILIPWNAAVPNDPLNKNKQWKVGAQSSYDFMTSATLECYLPRDPIYDPRLIFLIYDRRIKPKYFLGEFSFDLIHCLPWITDKDAALQNRVAYKDFTESVNLKRVAFVLQNAKRCSVNEKKGLINLGVNLLKSADEKTILERNTNLEDTFPQFTVKSDYISPSGVPIILLKSYESMKKHKRPVSTLDLNMFSLNVFIPARFVLAAHGVMAEMKKKDEYSRPSVEGGLENFLSDIIWEKMEVTKKFRKKIQTTGILQAAVSLSSGGKNNTLYPTRSIDELLENLLTAKGVSRSNMSSDVFPCLEDDRKFRQRFRGSKALPPLIRLRIYIIQAIALTPIENLRTINPFLVFKMGNSTENLRGNAKLKTVNPQFCLCQEYDITLPDQTRLEIAVWSRHQTVTGSDVFIGSTVLDLETRWFSKEWQRLITESRVPIEFRALYPQGDLNGTRSCGTLELWIEMMTPQKAVEIPRTVLKEPQPSAVELRVIVWGARALSFKRLKKEYVDAQVSSTLDCANYKGSQPVTQSTDVHYHSRNGNVIYNWRVVYSDIHLPLSSCVLQLVVYDFRTISSSVFIGEVNMDLRSYLEKVGVNLASREYDAELSLIDRTKGGKETAGFVQVTIQILPQQEASLRPAGLGRETPNRSPHLSTPLDGRKWEDFLRTVSFGKDFSKIMHRVRVIVTLFCLFTLFIISFIYPGLFQQ